MARKNDIEFRAGRATSDPTTLSAWLAGRDGHDIHVRWKNEEGTRGPLRILDRTDAEADPNKMSHGRIPYGSPYAGDTAWVTEAEAKRITKLFGLRLSEG